MDLGLVDAAVAVLGDQAVGVAADNADPATPGAMLPVDGGALRAV